MRFYEIKHCPECGSLWHDTPIPEESRHLFGGSKWFSRVILLSSWETDKGYESSIFNSTIFIKIVFFGLI